MFRRTKKVVRGVVKTVRFGLFVAKVVRIVKWFSAASKKEKASAKPQGAKKVAEKKVKEQPSVKATKKKAK